jgi:predicted metalloprotease with PDZ domain
MESGLSIAEHDFQSTRESSAQLGVLRWNQYVMLPKGRDAADISVVASVLVPAGWSAAGALVASTASDGVARIEPASVARLVDSPVQIGRHARRIEIAAAGSGLESGHSIAIVADSADGLSVPGDFLSGVSSLVAQTTGLFGWRAYGDYSWLLSLSDYVTPFGQEHLESSDIRARENVWSDVGRRHGLANTFAHELVHSWNGKYRRPRGLVSPDYQRPMDGSLLWVYEGLTTFWSDVLATRAGLMAPTDYRERLAKHAGNFDVSTGTRWRPLADTAVEAQVLFDAPGAWKFSRRGVDFYNASVLLWLDVDVELRARTQGKVSLDDFMKRFFAGTAEAAALRPYDEQEIYDTLETLASSDWRALVRRHLDETGTSAMFRALERAGWNLTYSHEPNSSTGKSTDRPWSIGLLLDEAGLITDVIEGRAAAKAGAGPNMRVIAVNGRKYSIGALDSAIAEAMRTREPIALLVENDGFYRTLSVQYFDGPRFPHLERVPTTPDTLSLVLEPRASP